MEYNFNLSIADNMKNLFESVDFDIENLAEKYGVIEIDGDYYINNQKKNRR